MNQQQLLDLLNTSVLVHDCGIQNGNQVYFHLVGVDEENLDECMDKGDELELWLNANGVDTTHLLWNDCEGYYGEGSLTV